MTDGPVVIFDINGAMVGNNVSVTKGANASLRILWNSTPEFGGISNIVVKSGVINGTAENNFMVIQPSAIVKKALCDEYELTVSPNESCYYRVEAYTNTTNGKEYRCYTNPVWVDVLADSTPSVAVFDTDESGKPYPSIAGTHKGTIIPSQNITVSKLYTYPCTGTGGHTKSIKLYENSTSIANGTWTGYPADNITITPSVTLFAGHTYNYTIVTGSYPQILHAASKEVTGGTITCTSFVDANGCTHSNWIPAIRLAE